jgi:2-oxoisovalerate dehydrogenase E2 component (dihydrolipoyl transacylase)
MSAETKVLELPDVGEGVTEALVVSVLVKEGDPIERMQAVVVIDSDKAEVEITSPWKGTVQRVHVEEGAYADVGSPVIEVAT